MKNGIHPAYKVVTVTCACGETFVTRSTKDDMRLEICAKCHPFFTGKQKLIDTAGRVERFEKRYKATTEARAAAAKNAAVKAAKAGAVAAKTGAAAGKSGAAAAEGKGPASGA